MIYCDRKSMMEGWFLSLEWKKEKVMDGDSGDDKID